MSTKVAEGAGAIRGRRSQAAFMRTARRRGVGRHVAKALEPAALELFPDQPIEVLNSRAAFERAAAHAVLGDASKLALSYRSVDGFATALETLGLARATEVPDPFRRVWLTDVAGTRQRGVVLRCERGEVAVFCPATHERFTPAGPIFKMSYRGFKSAVEFELKLCDAVRLPEALVVHLARPNNGGAIGRTNLRVDVQIAASVRALGDVEPIHWRESQGCEILDVSGGGLRIASDLPFGAEQEVAIEFPVEDSGEGNLSLIAKLCWNRVDDAGRRTQGLLIVDASRAESDRYLTFVSELLEREAEPQEPGADEGSVVAALSPALSPALESYPPPAPVSATAAAAGPERAPQPVLESTPVGAPVSPPVDSAPRLATEVLGHPISEPIIERAQTASQFTDHGVLPEEPRFDAAAGAMPVLTEVDLDPDPAPEATPEQAPAPSPEPATEAVPEAAADVQPQGLPEARPEPSPSPLPNAPEGQVLAQEIEAPELLLDPVPAPALPGVEVSPPDPKPLPPAPGGERVHDANLERAAGLGRRVASLEAELQEATARAERCRIEDHAPHIDSLTEQLECQSRDLAKAWEFARAAQRRADALADELHLCRKKLAERRSTILQATDLVVRLKPILGAIRGELLEGDSSGASEASD